MKSIDWPQLATANTATDNEAAAETGKEEELVAVKLIPTYSTRFIKSSFAVGASGAAGHFYLVNGSKGGIIELLIRFAVNNDSSSVKRGARPSHDDIFHLTYRSTDHQSDLMAQLNYIPFSRSFFFPFHFCTLLFVLLENPESLFTELELTSRSAVAASGSSAAAGFTLLLLLFAMASVAGVMLSKFNGLYKCSFIFFLRFILS